METHPHMVIGLHFQDNSHSNLMELHWKFQTIKKEGKSIDEYIEDAKELFDLMSATCDQISFREYILYLVGGLNYDFISLIMNITYMKNSSNIDEVFS